MLPFPARTIPSTALIIPFPPVNKLPNKLAPKVPRSILKNRPLCSLVSEINKFINNDTTKSTAEPSYLEPSAITRIKSNIFRIQAYDSIMCGYFCIEFINYMLKGKTLLDYTNLFSPNDFKKNDRIIKRIFKNE